MKNLIKFIFLVAVMIVIAVVCVLYADQIKLTIGPVVDTVVGWFKIAIEWIKKLFTKKETQEIIQRLIELK